MVLEYDATTKMLMKLGRALIKAIDEHGAPNTFTFSELVGLNDAMAAGKAAKSPHWGALIMNVNEHRPGTVITRVDGRIAVAHTDDPEARNYPVWFCDNAERKATGR